MALSIKEIRPARGTTLSSQIVMYIRDALFSGELAPGDEVLVSQLKAFCDAFWTPPRLPDPGAAGSGLRIHRDTFEIIEAGDYKTASELMREHLGDMLEKRYAARQESG